MNAARTAHDEARGLWLGLLGVVIFAMTLPMTRLAVGPADDPQLPPLFVTAPWTRPVQPALGFTTSTRVMASCAPFATVTEKPYGGVLPDLTMARGVQPTPQALMLPGGVVAGLVFPTVVPAVPVAE